MVSQQPDLWSLVQRPYVDAEQLSQAVLEQAGQPDNDYRSRLLVRDSLDVLEAHWGSTRFANWITSAPVVSQLQTIRSETFEKIGFPSLRHRIMDFTKTDNIEALFRAVGEHITSPITVNIGGSTVLLLNHQLSRATEDIDIVDEVPKALRDDHAFIHQLQIRFGLLFTHFQSHFLPSNWQERTQWHGKYGHLTVMLVDPIDILISKLFSPRNKDYTDIQLLLPQYDRAQLIVRIHRDCQSLLANESLKQQLTKNWYILTGDTLTL
jgi:Nucleotidyltransferase of unknown function (DUF6036)